jgi:hypothetical protein
MPENPTPGLLVPENIGRPATSEGPEDTMTPAMHVPDMLRPDEDTGKIVPDTLSPVGECSGDVVLETIRPAQETGDVAPETLRPAQETGDVAPETLRPVEENSGVVVTGDDVPETLRPAQETGDVAPETLRPVEETGDDVPDTLRPVEESREVEGLVVPDGSMDRVEGSEPDPIMPGPHTADTGEYFSSYFSSLAMTFYSHPRGCRRAVYYAPSLRPLPPTSYRPGSTSDPKRLARSCCLHAHHTLGSSGINPPFPRISESISVSLPP